MDALERIGLTGLVPVVVLEKAEDAVMATRALLDAGIDIMEITLRTDAALQAIAAIRTAYPEVLVGAGTVLSLEKAREAVAAGAQFIVSPGFNADIVQWCLEHNIPVTPGCVTPTEIDRALSYGLKILKFFPADIFGGLKACAAFNGPFGPQGVKFIPTGGVNNDNLADFADKPYIHAVGGSWLCGKDDIAIHNFKKITDTAAKAIDILLGFEFAHMGVNGTSEEDSLRTVRTLETAFKLTPKYGNSSNFAGPAIEVTKEAGLGKYGHIAIRVNNMERALYYLKKRGFTADENTAKYKGNKMNAIYLTEEIGGFAVHLLQK